MLSLKVHIPLCLCKRKSNLSLSLVGYLWLLSMIAITVSDSLSDRTDLKTSVPKQQLGNVAPKNSLLDSSSFYSDYKSSTTKKVETAENKDSMIFSSATRTTKPWFKKVTSTNEVQEASLSSEEIMIPKLPLLLGAREETLSADIEIYSSLYNWDVTAQIMSKNVLSDTSMITPRTPFASELETQNLSTFYREGPRVATDTSVTFVNINDGTKPEMSQNMITTTSINKDFTLKQFNINAGSSHTLISSFADGSRESISKFSHEQISHTHDIPPSISNENRNSTKTYNSDQPVTYQRHISSNMSGTRKESEITETVFLITNTTEQSFSTSSLLHIESFESSVSATTHHSDSSTYISSPGDARTTNYMSSPSSMTLRPTTSGTRYNSGQHKSSTRYETPLLPELPELQSSFNDNVYKTTHAFHISSTGNYETNTANPHMSYFNTDPLKFIPKETDSLPFYDLPEATIIVTKTISSLTEVLSQEITSPIVFTSSITVQSDKELSTLSPGTSEHFHSESDQEMSSKSSSVIPVFRHPFSSSTSQESVASSQQDTSQMSQKDFSDVSSVSLIPVESSLIELQHILSSKILNINSQSIEILSSNSSANFETEGHIDMLSTRMSTLVKSKTKSYESTSNFKSKGREMSALFSKTTPKNETVLPSDFSYIQASKSLEYELKMSYIETISLLNSKTSLLNGQISMDQNWLAIPSILSLANTYRILPSFTEVLNVNEDQLKTLYTQSSIFTAYDIPVLSTEGNIKRVSRIKSIQSFSAVETLEQKELKSYEILKIYKPGISLRSTKLLSKQFLPDIYDNTFIPDTPKVSGSDKIESFSGILLTDTIVELPSIIEQLHSEQRRFDSVATNKISITPSFSSGYGTGISEQNKLESSTVMFKTMTIEMSPQLTEKGTKQHKHKSSSQLFESSVSETTSASTKLKAFDHSEWPSELFQSYVHETLSNFRTIKTPELGPSYKTIQYFTNDVSSRFTELKTQEQDQVESYSKLGQSLIHKTSPPINILKTSEQNVFTSPSETSDLNSFIVYSEASVSDVDSFSSSILGVAIPEPDTIKLSSYTLLTEADYLSPSFSDLITSSQFYTVSLDSIWTYTKALSLRERSSAKWFRTSEEQRSSMLSGKISSASGIKSGSSYSGLNDIPSYFDTHAILLTSNLNRFQTHLSITDIQSFSAIEKKLLFSRMHDVSSTSEIYPSISSTNIIEIESSSGMSGHSQSSFTILSPFIVEENSSSSIINEDLTSSSINNVSNFSVSHQIPPSSTVINVFPQTSVMEAVMTSLGTDESPIPSFINGISPSLFLNEIQTTAINDIPTSSIIKVENPTSSFINQISSSSNIKQLSSSLVNYENPSFSVIDEIISSSSKYENAIFIELNVITISPDPSDISSSSSIYQFLTSTVTNKITRFSRINEFLSSSVINSVHSFVITEIMPSSSINDSPLPSVILDVPSSVKKKSLASSSMSKDATNSVINETLSTSTSSSIKESPMPSVIYEVPTSSVIKEIMLSTSINENSTSLAINKISTSSTINVMPSFLSSVRNKISSSSSIDKFPSFPVTNETQSSLSEKEFSLSSVIGRVPSYLVSPSLGMDNFSSFSVTNEIQSSLSEKEFSLSSVIDRIRPFLVKTEIMQSSIMKKSPSPSVIENVSSSLVLNENTSSSNKNEFSISSVIGSVHSSIVKNDISPSSGMDKFPSSPVINTIQSSLSIKEFSLSSVIDSDQPSLVMTEIIVRSKTRDTGISSSNAISLKSSERVTLSSSQFLTTETHNEPTLPIEPRFIETNTIEMTSNKDAFHVLNTTKVSLSTKYADLDLSQHSSPTTTISDKTLLTQHQTTIDTTPSVFSTYPTFTSSLALQDTVSEFPSISATPSGEKHTYTDKIEPSTFTHTRNIEIVSNSSLVTNYTEDFVLQSSMSSAYKTLGESFLNTVQTDTTAKTVVSFTKNKNSKMQNMSISSSREISVNESETELSIAGKYRSSSKIKDISMFYRVNAFIAENTPHSPESLDTISSYIEDVTTLSSEVTHMYYNKQSLDPHSTFLSLQSSSDAAVKLTSATFKSLSRSSDAQMKLSSSTFSAVRPSLDATVKLSSATFSLSQPSSDATMKFSASEFSSLPLTSDETLKLDSSTFTSVQPSSDAAVKLSSSTFSTLQRLSSDASVKLNSSTFSSSQPSSDATLKLSSATFSTLQQLSDASVKLISVTFSSLLPSSDAAVKLTSATFTTFSQSTDATVKLTSSNFSPLQPSSDAQVKLSSSTFSSLRVTSDVSLKLSSSTFASSLQSLSDSEVKISSAFTSLSRSSDVQVKLSSSTFSPVQPSSDTTVKLTSATFRTLSKDTTLKLTSSTFITLPPSSDATLNLSSAQFSPLTLSSDAAVKLRTLTFSTLQPSSDARLKLSFSTFSSLQPISDSTMKLSSSTFKSLQPSSHAAVKLSSSTFSSLQPTSDATLKLSSATFSSLLQSSHAAVELSSSTFSSLLQTADATLELSSSTFSPLLLLSDAQFKSNPLTISSLRPSSNAILKLSSSTFPTLQPSSLAAVQLSSSTFSSLLLSSDAQVKSNPSTISSLRPSSDATLKLSSGTFISLQPSSHATLELSSSTIPTLQPSSHAAMKLNSSTFSSLLQRADATQELSSSTFVSLQPSSHAAVKLSSTTFSSLLQTADATLELSSSTFSSLQQSSDSTVKLSSSTFSSLQPSSDATLELSSSTFTSLQPSSHAAVKLSSSTLSSLLQTADATVKLSSSTFSTLHPSSDATQELSSSTFSTLHPSSDATQELSSSTFTSLHPSSDAIQELSSSTFSTLHPSSDATQELSSSTFSTLHPSSDATQELSSSTFTSLHPSSDATQELSSSTFSTLHPSSDATQELSSSTLTSVQPSSHAAVKLTSSTFSSLQQSSDSTVKLSSSTFSSLQPLSDATLELSSSTFTSLQPSSHTAVKLSSSILSSLLQTADAAVKLSSSKFSSLLQTADATVKLSSSTFTSLQPSSHAAVKLSSSTFSSVQQSSDSTVKLNSSTFSTLHPSSHAAVKLSSSTLSSLLKTADAAVKLSSSTFSYLLQTADATVKLSSSTFTSLQPSSHAAVKLSSSTFSSLQQSSDSTVKLSSSTFSTLHPSSHAAVKLSSSTFSSLQPSSDATLELSSGTITSLQPSSLAAVKLSSSTFSSLLQTADATLELSSSTFSSLQQSSDSTVKLSSSTFSSLQPSSDATLELSSSTFTSLQPSSHVAVKLCSSTLSSLLQTADATVKLSSPTFSTLHPSSDATQELSSSTFSTLHPSSDATQELSSSTFTSLHPSSDATQELSSSTFSTLHPSSDAKQELSSSTFTLLHPSSHTAVKLSSSTLSSLLQTADAAVKLSSSKFSSLLQTADATVKLSSSTFTSLQPSSHAAVKLSSSTFSSLQQSSDSTVKLNSSTFSTLHPSSHAAVKLSSSTLSSLLQTADAAVKLSSSTFSSLLQTADATVKLSSSTFTSLQPSSHAAVKLSSSTFSSLQQSSDSTVKLSSSTFSTLHPSSHAAVKLSSSTFSSLQPSSDATLELSSGTITSLQPSSLAAVKLSSSTFSSLLQTADATVKLSSSTFSSLPLTADATLKLTSETFSLLPPSSDLDVNLFTTLSGSLDPEVKLIALISSSLLQLSEVELTSSKSPALFKEDFIPNTYSSSFEYELSAHPESSIFDTPSSYDNRVISSESSMPTTEKPCTEVILTGSHLPKKLSSSLSGTYLSDSLSYTSSGLRENASHISSSSTIPLVSSMPVTEMHFISSYSVSLFPTTISKQLQKPRTERITSRSLDISETINGTGFKSDLESKIFRVSSFITNPNEMPSSLHLFGTVQNQTEDLFNSETPTSIRSSSLSTRLKPSLSKLDTETVEVSSTYNFETFSLSTTPNQYFTKEPSSTVSEETDDPQITTDTLVSMTRKDERTFKSDLSYTSLVLLSSKVSETSSSIYTSSSLTSEITSALSQGMNSLTSTPSLIVHTEDLHLPDSRVQIGISPSKTVEIDIEDQMSKQSIIPSSRTLSSQSFQETAPLPSLRYQLSVSVTSKLTLTSSSVGNEDSFSSTKSKDVLQISLSTRDQLLATTSTASSSILPLTVIETSTSILPRNIDKDLLLTVGIIVKTSVNIDSHAVNIQIKEGLKRCFIEGGLKADKDSYRKKRANADANVTVEIFGMERKESEPSHVDVDFYVLVDGIIQSPAEIVVIFSRLTIAETSAYMTFPVISSVKLLSRNVLQAPTDVAADSNISLVTIFLIGAPTICAFIATVLLISVYCRKGDNSFRKNWSSLHDADLKVDIEKGEVVSASVSRNKNIPDFSFDNGKDFGSDWTHIKPFLHSSKEFQKKEQSCKRSLSDIFSTSKRFDRLRNLGFHVSEVRKPGQPQSKEIREVDLTPNTAHELKISKEEYLVDAIDALNVINDLDKATDSGHVTCSVEPLREVIEQCGYNDVTNESDRRTRSVTFQPKVRNSSSSATEFYPNIRSPCNDSHVNISTAIDSLVYQSSDSYSDKNIQTKHSSTSKKIFSNRKRKKLKRRKKVKPDCLSNVNNSQLRNHLFESVQNQSPNSRPRVPSIPVEGYCNKIMFEPFYTSLTLGKEPLAVNNFIEGDIEDEVFFTDSFPLHNHNGKGGKAMIPKSIPASPETAHSLAASRYKGDQMKYLQKRSKSINKKEAVSRNNCDIIRNPLEVNSADTVKLEDNEGSNLCQSNNSSFQGSFLQDYVKHWSDDPFFLNTCFESYPDGSEFAGHEFESLNFNRDYTRSPSGDLHFQPIFPGEEIQDSNMAEMVVTETFPGMYEHVTKMGRVGKNHRDLHSAGPQFRKLPFQDQTFPMTQTSTPVSTPTPRKSEPVILKEFQRLPFLPLYPKKEVMKDIGIQTVGSRKAGIINGNGIYPNAKYVPKSDKGTAEYEKDPSAGHTEHKRRKNKWVEVVENKAWRRQDLNGEYQKKRNSQDEEQSGEIGKTKYQSKKKIDNIDENVDERSDKSLKKKDNPDIEPQMKHNKYKNKWVSFVENKGWRNKGNEDFENLKENEIKSMYNEDNPNEKVGEGKSRKTRQMADEDNIDESIEGDEYDFDHSKQNLNELDPESLVKHRKYKSKWASVFENKGWKNKCDRDVEKVKERKSRMDNASETRETEYSTGKKTFDKRQVYVFDDKPRDEKDMPKGKDSTISRNVKASRNIHRFGRKNAGKPKLENGFKQKNEKDFPKGKGKGFEEQEDDDNDDEEITSLGFSCFENGEEVANTEHVTDKKTLSGTSSTETEDNDEENNEEIPAYNVKRRHIAKRRKSDKEEIATSQRSRPQADITPFVEMKLGRNMRAAPKGSLASMSASDANTQLDASVPLLHNHTLHSNHIADYFANTHSALRPQTQGSGIASRQYPSRSITSPQHPSQDLIETLNRNNLTSLTQETRLQDEQRKAAERQERLEASLKLLQEEERRRTLEQAKEKPLIDVEEKLVTDFETKNTLLDNAFPTTQPKTEESPFVNVTSPPPPMNLYGSYRMSENFNVEQKSSEQVSTQPFSPPDSMRYNRGGETTATTTTSLKEVNSGFTAAKSVSVEKQETVDDVEDIEEDIDEDIEEYIKEDSYIDESDNDKMKEDDFDF